MSEVPPELAPVVAKTAAELSAIISKPKMVDKHLAKPPFRFIHDIVTEITAVTGFAAGLFEGIELDGKALKEKEEKLGYLNKLLKYTEDVLGQKIDVRTAKIVAGAEAENTNDFLQAIGRAALIVKSGGGPKAGGAAPADDGAAAREAAEKEAAAKEAAAKEAAAREAERKRKAAADDAERRQEEERRRQEAEAAEANAKAEAARKQAAAAPKATPAAAAAPSGNTLEALRIDGTYDRTRELLEPLISKPKLLDKHLSKPPMRFLHDVVTAVTEATGFAQGLFTAEELDSNNLKEKPAKVQYLDKLINLIGIHTGVYCPAKSGKIVAGLEPEATNMMLQLIGIAVQRGDTSAAVSRVLAGEAQPEPSEGGDAGGGDDGGAAAAQAEADRQRAAAAERQQEEERREAQRQAAAKREAEENRARERDLAAAQERQRVEAERAAREAAQQELEAQAKFAAQQPPSPQSGAAASGMPMPIQRSSRPMSAQRRPPKVKENTVATAAPAMSDSAAVGIMKEGAADSDEEDNNGDDKTSPAARGGAGISRAAAGAGKHTRDILNEEKKAEPKEAQKDNGASGIKMGRIGKAKGDVGAFSEIDLEKLREGIQKVCRSTDPLGRSMEYVNEDLGVMKKELEQWRDEYTKRNDAMITELKETEEVMRPLRSELQGLEEKIREYQASIVAVKSAIFRNESRIGELLKLVVAK